MLGGQRNLALVNELSPTPTLGRTAGLAFEQPFQQISQLNDYIFPGESTEESRQKTADRLSIINETLNDPRQGTAQHALNSISGLAGSIVPTLPFALAGAAVGTGVAGAVGFGVREAALELGTEGALSSYLSTQVPLKTLSEGALSHYLPGASAAEIATGIGEAYTGYKGMIIPEHFAEHYNAIENSMDANHAIKDWASDNYGFLLGAIPLGAGYVAFKGIRGIIKQRAANLESKSVDEELSRLLKQHEEVLKENEIKVGEQAGRQAKVSELQDHLEQAESEGLISPEMHEWYLDYLENPKHQKVHEGGLKVMQQLQIPYDRVTGRVWNEVLSREGVKNLQGAMFDQGITNFSKEENQLLSSYVIHNELDAYVGNMRENPNLLHAIQGMTHDLEIRVGRQLLHLEKFDKSITKNIPKTLLKKQRFSQDDIYRHLKNINVYHERELPYTLPLAVMQKLKLLKQIKRIESRNTAALERKFQNGEHLKLKNIERSLKLLKPADELMDLRERLMPKGKLKSDFKTRKAYHRLEELSQVWPDAQHVLDLIHMKELNIKQQGLNNILKQFTDLVDKNASQLAKPEAIKRYLKTRIENAVPFVKKFEAEGIKFDVDKNAKASREFIEKEISSNNTSEISEEHKHFMDKVENSGLEFAKDEFKMTEKKYHQFNENSKALDELIKCALGE